MIDAIRILLRVLLLQLGEIVDPVLEGPVADQLDVLEADDLVGRAGPQLGVARRGVDDLRRVEAHGLADHAAPAQIVRAGDDLAVGAGRTRAEHERVVELHAVDGDGQIDRHVVPLISWRERLAREARFTRRERA
jgi:hypothetical protein